MESVITFQAGLPIAVVGPTGSGKSTFVKKLVQFRKSLFKPTVSKVLYCYGVWDSAYDELMMDDDVEMMEGLPDAEKIGAMNDGNFNLLILDDLLGRVVDDINMQELFCVHARHFNITTVFVTQNLYQKGKYSRTISLQIQTFILFKNRRDVSQIKMLGRQMFCSKGWKLIEAYDDVIASDEYGYVVVDSTPHCHEDLRIRTRIFPLNGQYFPIVYGVSS